MAVSGLKVSSSLTLPTGGPGNKEYVYKMYLEERIMYVSGVCCGGRERECVLCV